MKGCEHPLRNLVHLAFRVRKISYIPLIYILHSVNLYSFLHSSGFTGPDHGREGLKMSLEFEVSLQGVPVSRIPHGSRIPQENHVISHAPQIIWTYPASRMTFAQFEARIPRNFVINPESRRQKRSYPASRETQSGPPNETQP